MVVVMIVLKSSSDGAGRAPYSMVRYTSMPLSVSGPS